MSCVITARGVMPEEFNRRAGETRHERRSNQLFPQLAVRSFDGDLHRLAVRLLKCAIEQVVIFFGAMSRDPLCVGSPSTFDASPDRRPGADRHHDFPGRTWRTTSGESQDRIRTGRRISELRRPAARAWARCPREDAARVGVGSTCADPERLPGEMSVFVGSLDDDRRAAASSSSSATFSVIFVKSCCSSPIQRDDAIADLQAGALLRRRAGQHAADDGRRDVEADQEQHHEQRSPPG